jgi:hypothetical protein
MIQIRHYNLDLNFFVAVYTAQILDTMNSNSLFLRGMRHVGFCFVFAGNNMFAMRKRAFRLVDCSEDGDIKHGVILSLRCLIVCQAILLFTLSHVRVIKKLSFMLPIILMNLFIGTAKVSVSFGTYGRADTSNMPSTARGRTESLSR